MISGKLLMALLLGTFVMMIPIMIQAGWHKIRFWKSVMLAVVLTIAGTMGTRIWFLLENHRYGGQSFFGAVFIVPIVFWVFAKLIKIPYGIMMDLCAPAECAMLVIMKINCLMDDCCGGKALFTTANGVVYYFPSQIVEMTIALILAVILIILAKRESNQRTIYSWYLLLYGSTRFVLDFYRENSSPVAMGLSIGSIWALCSFVIGGSILLNKYNLRKKNKVKIDA